MMEGMSSSGIIPFTFVFYVPFVVPARNTISGPVPKSDTPAIRSCNTSLHNRMSQAVATHGKPRIWRHWMRPILHHKLSLHTIHMMSCAVAPRVGVPPLMIRCRMPSPLAMPRWMSSPRRIWLERDGRNEPVTWFGTVRVRCCSPWRKMRGARFSPKGYASSMKLQVQFQFQLQLWATSLNLTVIQLIGPWEKPKKETKIDYANFHEIHSRLK